MPDHNEEFDREKNMLQPGTPEYLSLEWETWKTSVFFFGHGFDVTHHERHMYYSLLPGDTENLDQSPFNASLPTLIVYHGFWGTANRKFLKISNSSVISVDYRTLVVSPWYNYAVENVYRVSNYTAAMLEWMHENAGFRAENAHFVGHSLGAHTAGLTAKYFTVGTVARVTGLDPAGPLFYDKPPDRRLDRSDATFVDVMHANGGSLVQGCIAMNQSLGHVDFYPNGGMHQPGCSIGDPVSNWMDLFADCSHMRAASLWVESIRATTWTTCSKPGLF
ncbi:pancreatic triacylglycerol lipase-like [Penaeus japonicus]|uniref:pancreatic triacylglycerol lipase-like n=1 Tax=Penaeus japonicus TaxID=27405 RepID=UPI001C70E950|nr:pancreatic triacylglycerol lipase-like [Penaeus japonicus]